eukprot:1143592-Pelagomonas_calceolata.AAC.1
MEYDERKASPVEFKLRYYPSPNSSRHWPLLAGTGTYRKKEGNFGGESLSIRTGHKSKRNDGECQDKELLDEEDIVSGSLTR